ncbi:hypothetical protein I553_2820 [Mycobacterium xenopi 4042]|uniref:Uncharacterized protein n=1 Tax=Mycobacterium xenopi 4042 TaxID=1299334 RepID=X8EEA5_MYCXE|nr:hypothetical protein I553_2820 [Mycobacterium xenopi 4042]
MPKIKERVDSFPHSRLEELPHPAGAPALEPGAPKGPATHRLKLHRQLSQRLAAEGWRGNAKASRRRWNALGFTGDWAAPVYPPHSHHGCRC